MKLISYRTYCILQFIVVLFLITSCCKHEKNYNGYWYGKYNVENKEFHYLSEITDSCYYEYTVPFTKTFFYDKDCNTFVLPNGKIKPVGDDLLYSDKTHGITVRLKRAVEKSFILEKLNDKDLKVDLVDAEDCTLNNFEPVNGNVAIYLGQKSGITMCSYKNNTMVLNDDFCRYMNQLEGSLQSTVKFSVAIDREVKYRDFKKFTEYLGLLTTHGGYMYLLVKPQKYIGYSFMSKSFSFPLSKKDYYKERGLFFHNEEQSLLPPPTAPNAEWLLNTRSTTVNMLSLIDNNIFFDNKICELKDIERLVMNNSDYIKANTFIYYIDPETKYEDYFKFLNKIKTVYSKITKAAYSEPEGEYIKSKDRDVIFTEVDSLYYGKYIELLKRH
jgi:hypothetical protein